MNAIRSEIERVDDETKWAALELIIGTNSSVVALAKKMAKPETKTVTQQVAPKDTERPDFTPMRPQPPLPNQRDDREKC